MDYDLTQTPSAIPPRPASEVMNIVIKEQGVTVAHGLPIRATVEIDLLATQARNHFPAAQAILDYASYYRAATGYDWGVCLRLAQEAYYG